MSNDVLHIYAQAYQHREAWIVGTKGSLTALRDALTAALEADKPLPVLGFTNDGEGYKVLVWPVSEEMAQEFRAPYTDPIGNPKGKSPFMLMDRDTYRRLAR